MHFAWESSALIRLRHPSQGVAEINFLLEGGGLFSLSFCLPTKTQASTVMENLEMWPDEEYMEEARDAVAPEALRNSSRNLLHEEMRGNLESPKLEVPGRPSAPHPTPVQTPNPTTQKQSAHTLAPERPLKLFRLEDFEFLSTLGTGTFGRVQLVRYRTRNVEKYFAMKVLKKTEVVRLKQVDHVFSEKGLLGRICFPFIVKL